MVKSNLKEETAQEAKPDYIGHRQRLKARFMADEGRSMPDYELLELVLTYALPRCDVKPLAKTLLKHYTCLANVLAAPASELMAVSGVGSNVAALCALIHACSNKICWENLENKDAPVLTNKKHIADYCRSCIGHSGQEHLLVIYLTVHGKYIGQNIEQVGTLDAVMISPREIVKKALAYHAGSIIMAHNHPSGDCMPSTADIQMTMQVKDALATVGVVLTDHLIITASSHYSMRERLPILK